MSNYVDNWKAEIDFLGTDEKRQILQLFFKTGKGEYGEGDIFAGVPCPETRAVSRQHLDASFDDIREMLGSPVHEHRLSGLFVLVELFRRNRRNKAFRKEIVDFYLTLTQGINNWDLVDLTAPKILGEWVLDTGDVDILRRLSRSDNMWEQRIAIVSTWTIIRAHDYALTLEFCKQFLPHKHPLIHKASGWMLREVGKRGGETELLDFLDAHVKEMPRTMLRYAIERLPQVTRRYYMSL